MIRLYTNTLIYTHIYYSSSTDRRFPGRARQQMPQTHCVVLYQCADYGSSRIRKHATWKRKRACRILRDYFGIRALRKLMELQARTDMDSDRSPTECDSNQPARSIWDSNEVRTPNAIFSQNPSSTFRDETSDQPVVTSPLYGCIRTFVPRTHQTTDTVWDFKFSRRRVWCSELSSGMFCRVNCLLTLPWRWWQYAPLKRRPTYILHGCTSQKTILNDRHCVPRKIIPRELWRSYSDGSSYVVFWLVTSYSFVD
jgi:hypothetical protein